MPAGPRRPTRSSAWYPSSNLPRCRSHSAAVRFVAGDRTRNPRIKSLTRACSQQPARDRRAGQQDVAHALGLHCTGSNCNPDCNPACRDAPLPSGPVMAQKADGFVQWPLPALGAAASLAGHLDVAAAGSCGSPALARSPGDRAVPSKPRQTFGPRLQRAMTFESRGTVRA